MGKMKVQGVREKLLRLRRDCGECRHYALLFLRHFATHARLAV